MAKKNAKGTPDVTTKAPTRQMWRRSVVVLVVLVGFCFSAIVGRLAVLQIVQTDEWQQRAVSQQLSDSIISPKRGTIYDTNMNPLAQSATVWTVIMSPKDIPDDETRTKIADELSVLLDVDRDKLLEQTQKTNSQYEVVKAKIELPLRDSLAQWVQDNELTGVFRTIEDYKRYYPNNDMLSTVLGFTGTDNYGLYGLEAYYEETLAGKAGRIVTAKNGWGDEMPNELKYEKTVDAEDGNSLVLTIDSVIQRYAEKYLANAVKETGCTNRGAAIVMNVKTGAILAMATEGGFDLNNPMEITDPDAQALIAELSGDEQSEAIIQARQEQWVNKPISDFYEPGSVFKVFTASMALEEGVVTESSTFNCNGYLMRGGFRMNCHKRQGHGLQTFAETISNSCNPAFIQIGELVGAERFFKYFTGFGFTEKTGIDMLSESKVTSELYHDTSELGETQLAASSFGQTFKVTPIQMITAMCAVANGGKLMQPYVVQQILDSDGNVVKNVEPVVKRQVISSDTSAQMCKILADAVNGGGSKNAYVAGYRMAGKTGTSDKTDQQVAENEKKDVVASFSGFAPADDPEVAILVLLDEPHAPINFRRDYFRSGGTEDYGGHPALSGDRTSVHGRGAGQYEPHHPGCDRQRGFGGGKYHSQQLSSVQGGGERQHRYPSGTGGRYHYPQKRHRGAVYGGQHATEGRGARFQGQNIVSGQPGCRQCGHQPADFRPNRERRLRRGGQGRQPEHSGRYGGGARYRGGSGVPLRRQH